MIIPTSCLVLAAHELRKLPSTGASCLVAMSPVTSVSRPSSRRSAPFELAPSAYSLFLASLAE